MHSSQALLTGLIDYAGLFPPANLLMAHAVSNYASYCKGQHGWILGRFIVPVSRLDEFESAAKEFLLPGDHGTPWRLSALAGRDLEDDLVRLAEFNRLHADTLKMGAAVVDAIEITVSTVEDIRRVTGIVPTRYETYLEIPINDELTSLISAIAAAGVRAKVRTGGITQDMFPSTADVARFLHECAESHVRFKATAGLHHAIRSVRKLTYEQNSPSGIMHGFMNVFLAAAFLSTGMDVNEAIIMLEEQRHGAFRFDDDAVSWRDRQISGETLVRVRREFAIAFGSCSFLEPIAELKAMNLL